MIIKPWGFFDVLFKFCFEGQPAGFNRFARQFEDITEPPTMP